MGPKGRKFSVSNFFGFGGNKDDSKSKQLATKSATFTAASAAQVDAFREDTKVQQQLTTRPLPVMQLSLPSSETQIGKDSSRDLEPILSHIHSTSTKLYREGYFHVLDDLTVDGKPIPNERRWKVCFAQLTGTNLSLWDAVELEAAGEQPVTPRYLNLTDSSMKMIKDLPTRDGRGIPLQNILSISTAGENRFLFNFESFHDMAQWTAAIRLAKFENASLLEAYTGSLLAGKGKTLGSIKDILTRQTSATESWVQVRFASGTPWEKVYCVISPPDEKAFQKHRKLMQKQQQEAQNIGQGEAIPYLKGEIKFYKTNKKIKKSTPYAAIKSAYACYAVFPERKEMIEYSSLIKIEGTIEFYGAKPNVVEAECFIWPDPQPGVLNMELMLKWLVRAFDVFALYGRPGRLIADCSFPESIMFGMANDRRGALEVVDVASMLITEVDANTTEAMIRQRLKELTRRRMMRLKNRNSVLYQNKASNVAFDDGRSSESSSPAYMQNDYGLNSAARSTPSLYRQMRPTSMIETGPKTDVGPNKKFNRLSHQPLSTPQGGYNSNGFPAAALERSEEDDEDLFAPPVRPNHETPTDVPTTPQMEHAPNARPTNPPQSNGVPPQRRVSNGTLTAMMASQGVQQPKNDGYFPPQLAAPKPPADRNSLNLQTPLVPGGHRRALYTPPLLDQYTGSPSSGAVSPNIEPIRAYNNAADNGVLPSPKPMRPIESSHVVEDVEEAAKRVSVPPPPLPQLPASLDDSFADNLEDNLFSWNKQPAPTQQQSNGLSLPPLPKIPDSQVEQRGDKTPLGTENFQGPMANGAQRAQDEDSPEEEDKELTQMIRNVAQLERIPTSSDAASIRTYNTVTSDDYASTIDSNEGKPPPRREIAPRFGTMKTVGTLPPLVPPPAEVVIGDAHFRPSSAEQETAKGPPVDIPKVDFGKTVSHVRTLSAETIGPSYTQGNANRVSTFANVHGFGNEVQPKKTPDGLDTKRSSTNSSGTNPREGHRRSPGPGMLDASKRNSSYGPTTPQDVRNGLVGRPKDGYQRNDSSGGNQTNSSNSSDAASQQNRRSMAWAPGMVKTPAARSEVDRAQAAEQYVKDRSAEAQATTRARYRRVSTNALATQSNASQQGSAVPVPYSQPPSGPRSRGGNAAFIPNGLVSQSQDMSSHLSAREQEFLARQTGSTLLQINTVKQPPHQAGLLGLLETREGERERMKKATWNGGVDPNSLNNATLNQALAQREGMRQEQERQTLIQERERMVQQSQHAQQQQRQSMMSQQELFARGGTPGPAVDPRQSYQDRSRTPSNQTLLGGRVSSPEPTVQYSHQSTYQPQHVTQYQQYHQAQQRGSIYGAPNPRQSMLPGQYQAAMDQQAQLQMQQQQLQLNQMQQQLFQQQMQQQAAAAPVMPMQNQMVNMSNQQVGYQPPYQPAQTPQPYGYFPPQSPPPTQQYSQYGGR